uniref:ARAD1C03344p n=1 Tax=Blastobotrys adeninivorans TaxID=409370 RepID=A0A060T4C3_BLAAD
MTTQINYNGPGWNDCPLVASRPSSRPASRSASRSMSRSSKTPSTTSLSDLGMTSSAPPKANGPPPPVGMTSRSQNQSMESLPETETEAPAPDKVLALLSSVLGLESSLAPKELDHYRSRLESILPTLEPVHLSVAYNALETKNKNLLVEHSLVHSGISTWVLPLRRILESIKA